MSAPPPDVSQKLIIGLDTWVWRDLAAAHTAKDSPLYPAAKALLDAVESEQVAVPLAQTVYLEIGAKSINLRTSVANLARRLSRWYTFLPAHIRARQEVDRVLRARFGRPLRLDPSAPDVGWGVTFAVTGETERLAYVGSDVGAFVREQGFERSAEFLGLADDWIQYQLFRGPDQAEETILRESHGFAPECTWSVVQDRKERHQRMRDALLSNPDLKSRPQDLVDASELGVEINNIILERMAAAGIEPDELFKDGIEGLRDFLDELPSSVVRRTLIRHALMNHSRQLSINDISDGDLYAEIVPASHIVVAEKSVQGALSRSGVDRRYGARVLRGRDLPNIGAILADFGVR